MSAKKHYENHLGNFYSWMLGDTETKSKEFKSFLLSKNILPRFNKQAIDLGAGNGLQSLPLAQLGFDVTSVDFNKALLEELKQNFTRSSLPVTVIESDITDFSALPKQFPELILCCGDTISHLNSKDEIIKWLRNCYDYLLKDGFLFLSFRDYTHALEADARFIPVMSDENRIHTCVLDYFEEKVRVTDLLYEKQDLTWKMKISSYDKVRISTDMIRKSLNELGFEILFQEDFQRMITILSKK